MLPDTARRESSASGEAPSRIPGEMLTEAEIEQLRRPTKEATELLRNASELKPLGVVLAGGLAQRMGGVDKGLLELRGRTILASVVGRLSPQVPALALNANGDPARFADYALPVIADGMADRPGPLAGVLAGLDWAAEQGATAIVTAAADTPFLPADLVTRLCLAAAGPPLRLALAAAEVDGRLVRHPTFGLWPVALREDLRSALRGGVRKVVAWTDGHGAATAVFPSPEAFFNVNTPEDLDRARAMADEIS